MSKNIFRKVTIIGVGLMGGSLGLALKKYELAREIVGYSHRQASLMEALEMKAIDIAETDLGKAVRNADIVILAAPVGAIIKTLGNLSSTIRRHTIVTDLGSTKIEIVDTANKVLPDPRMFVGSHPLIGSEQKGVRFAKAELFEKAICLMTPTEQTGQVAKEKVKLMWSKIGANVQIMSPVDHDRSLAYISHLPHLIAFGLIETVPAQLLNNVPRSLLDITRVASSPPQLWNDICLTNAKNLLKALDEFVKILSTMRKNIVAQNQRDLTYQFSKAKEKRDGIKIDNS